MKKIYIAIMGLVVIAAGATAWKQTNSNKTSMATSQSSTHVNTISAMQKEYGGYKGVTYDKMFISGMVAHHTGAVDMANLALTNAKHQEIKDLATAIVAAQTSEIASMTSWKAKWGYSDASSNMHGNGATMGDHMASMTDSLKSKTGEDFDKAFLTEMTAHHQEAIDMSRPAATNASHQEVKTLANNIITAQTKEMSEMRSW